LQHKSKSSSSVETLPSSAPLPKLPDPVPDILKSIPLVEPRKPPRVTLINAAAYSHASKLEGSNCFQLRISLPEVTGHSTTTSKTKVDMSTIPEDYHDFMDIFSKSKASKLADHRPYNLKITLDEGTSPPYSPIYSLSQEELAALHKFIDENLATGLICPSCSPMEHQSSLFRRKTALFDFVSTSKASTEFPRKTDTHFRSFPTS